MSFGEKLFKLRKEKGYSQEALAERLNTTRQAISKWENNQGYPETEKLIIISDAFEVSIDYLLKDSIERENNQEDGYFVSKEMAENYLLQNRKISNRIAIGSGLLILAFIPYLLLAANPVVYTLILIFLAAFGIVTIISTTSLEDVEHKNFKKEKLMIEGKYLDELTLRYKQKIRKYSPIIVIGFFLLISGVAPFFFEKKNITVANLESYYPIFVVMTAIGTVLLILTLTVLDAYKLIVNNKEYTNRFGFKIRKKFQKRFDDFQ